MNKVLLRATALLIILYSNSLIGQNDSANYSLRKTLAYTGSAAAYGGSLTGLYFLWYNDYSSGSFHCFNDNKEWFGMDKIGHGSSAISIAAVQTDVFEWAGMERRKAILWGSGVSMAFMTTIEVFDGFSDGWGFSFGDMLANTAGISLFAGQELLFNNQPVRLKYSMHPSIYAEYNPDLLGKNLIEQTLKDYNGQTYWLSFNMASCMKPESNFPKWLNIALGYGAEGMIGATSNPGEINGVTIPHFQRYLQFYISPDIDFSKIKIRNPRLAFLIKSLNFIKIPAPAFEWNRVEGMKFHAVYF